MVLCSRRGRYLLIFNVHQVLYMLAILIGHDRRLDFIDALTLRNGFFGIFRCGAVVGVVQHNATEITFNKILQIGTQLQDKMRKKETTHLKKYSLRTE